MKIVFNTDNEAGPSEEEEGGGGGDGDEEEEEEEVSSLQIAWEVLELSRIIYSRQESTDAQRKLAKVKIKLGEVCEVYRFDYYFLTQILHGMLNKLWHNAMY